MTIDRFTGQHAYLSNFYPSAIVIHGITYPSGEHAFQAGKTDNQDDAWIIAHAATPAIAKRAGRQVQLRPDWEERKNDWMAKVLYEKFRQHPELLKKLADTGEELLVEGNTWHDQIWGDCTCPRHANTPGDNRLGHLLMKTRAELALWGNGAPQ